jgi:hypothetical protein
VGGQRLRQLDGVLIDVFASVKYRCQHLDGGSLSPDLPQMELQGAAGGHLEVLQQVPESCIRKIILFTFRTHVAKLGVRSTRLYSSRTRGALVSSGKIIKLVITRARTLQEIIDLQETYFVLLWSNLIFTQKIVYVYSSLRRDNCTATR